MNIRKAQDEFEAWAKNVIPEDMPHNTLVKDVPAKTKDDLLYQVWIKKTGRPRGLKTWIRGYKYLSKAQISEAMLEAWLEATERCQRLRQQKGVSHESAIHQN